MAARPHRARAMQASIWAIGWNWNPVILAGLGLGLYAYLAGLRRFRPRRRQVVQFVTGLGLVFVALISPLDRVADRYLFSLHVAQHMLLQMAAAPLLVLAIPAAALDRWRRHPTWGRLMPWRGSAVPAAILYNGVLALWHLPVALGGPRLACGIRTDVASQIPWISTLQDLLPLGAGLLFWGAVLLAHPFSGAPRGVRLAVLGGTWVFNWLVSFVNATAGRPLYATYFAAPRLFGLSPMADQMLGAGLLWEHGNMVYALAIVGLVREWLRSADEGAPDSRAPSPALGPAKPGA